MSALHTDPYPYFDLVLAERWLARLEKADLPQGRTYLVSGIPSEPASYAYCCLGIACLEAGARPQYLGPDLRMVYEGAEGVAPLHVPPLETEGTLAFGAEISPDDLRLVFTGLGRLSEVAVGRAASFERILIQLNDRYHWTFPEIAQFARAVYIRLGLLPFPSHGTPPHV